MEIKKMKENFRVHISTHTSTKTRRMSREVLSLSCGKLYINCTGRISSDIPQEIQISQ